MHAVPIFLLLALVAFSLLRLLRRQGAGAHAPVFNRGRLRWWMSLVAASALVVTVVVATVRSLPVAPARFLIMSASADHTTLPTGGAQPVRLLVRLMCLRASGAHWVPVACSERLVDGDQALSLQLDAPAHPASPLIGGEYLHAEVSFPALSTLPSGRAGLDTALGQLRCTNQRGLTARAEDVSAVSLAQMLDAHHGFLRDGNWQDAPLSLGELLAVLPAHERGDLAVYLSAQLIDRGVTLQHQELTSAWLDARTPPLGVFNDAPLPPGGEPAGVLALRHLHLAGIALLLAVGLIARCSGHPYRTAVIGALSAMLLVIALERLVVASDLRLVHDPAISAPQRAQAIAQAHGTFFYRQLVARALPADSTPP